MACYGCSMNSKDRVPRHTRSFTVVSKKLPLIRVAGYPDERLRFVSAVTRKAFNGVNTA